MSFTRKIKKNGKTYLAEVESKWIDGKCVQKHIRYLGKEVEGEKIISISSKDLEFVVTFSHAVKVSEGQSPFLALTVEDQPRQAHFDRGSEGSQKGVRLFFIYEVQPNDNDSDGVSLAKLSIDLNGGQYQRRCGTGCDKHHSRKIPKLPKCKGGYAPPDHLRGSSP